MSVTPVAAVQLPAKEISLRPEWIYPPSFRRIAGMPPGDFTLPKDAAIGVETDWVRNPDGTQLKRYSLSADIGKQEPQINYVDRYAGYLGEFDMSLLPASVLAAANAVYTKWGMGSMSIHKFSNPGSPLNVSWASAPKFNVFLKNFSPEFIEWASANRPELIEEPYGGNDPLTALQYPDKMVVQYQESAVLSGYAIQESMVHPGVPPSIIAKNDKLLAAQRKKLDQMLKDALGIA